MSKYKCKNGWTKALMLEHIKENFKGKSATSGGTCFYRTEDDGSGKKCAIGLFIPNGKYKVSMEGKISDELFRVFPSLGKIMPLKNEGMRDLQHVHDRSIEENTLQDMLTWIKERVI